MDFETWLAREQYDSAALTPLQRTHLRAAWTAETGPTAAPISAGVDAEVDRQTKIRRVVAAFERRYSGATFQSNDRNGQWEPLAEVYIALGHSPEETMSACEGIVARQGRAG